MFSIKAILRGQYIELSLLRGWSDLHCKQPVVLRIIIRLQCCKQTSTSQFVEEFLKHNIKCHF